MRLLAWMGGVLLAACGPAPSRPAATSPAPAAIEPTAEPPPRSEAAAPWALPGPAVVAGWMRDGRLLQREQLLVGQGADAPAMFVERVFTAPGATFGDARFDDYVVVVAGRAELRDGGGKRHALGPWSAFRVRGGRAQLTQVEEAHLIQVRVPADGSSVPETLIASSREPEARRVAQPTEVVDLSRVEDLSWAGGRAHYRLAFEDGSASLGVLVTEPGVPVPPHAHDSSWEVLALLSVDGVLLREPGSNERDLVRSGTLRLVDGLVGMPLSGGQQLHIEPGRRHGFAPGDGAPTVGLQLYVPPGPEQRFKELAAQR